MQNCLSEAEVGFVSLDGEMKEEVLWYGRFHSGVARRATLLPHWLHAHHGRFTPYAPIPSLLHRRLFFTCDQTARSFRHTWCRRWRPSWGPARLMRRLRI